MSQSHPHNRNIGEIPFWGHIWILRAFTCTTTLFQFQNNFQNSRSFGPISGWSLWRLHDWLVVSTTHLKHILVKIGKSSPNSNRGENKQYLKPLPIAGDYHLSYKPPRPTHKAKRWPARLIVKLCRVHIEEGLMVLTPSGTVLEFSIETFPRVIWGDETPWCSLDT